MTTPRRQGSQRNSNNAGSLTQVPTRPAEANVNHSMHSTVSEITTDLLSTVSENPVDYEVVPRGAIYLPGCQVAANDALSLPAEGLFAFTIVPPRTAEDNLCHLAARTEEARATWVAKLSRAATVPTRPTTRLSGGNNHTTSTTNEEDANNNEHSAEGADEEPSTSWKSVSPQQTLFDNVPTTLAARVEQTLESHLELCDASSDENDDAAAMPSSRYWTPIFQNRDGVSAYQRQDLHGRTMMKSTAIIPHHPKQVMSLLLDPGRRPLLEPNVALSERLEVVNAFTFLDYYAYKAVWPTSPRDFAVVVHWQALQRQRLSSSSSAALSQNKNNGNASNNTNTEEALVTLAFSCPEADDLKEPTSPHVRAKLHASFYLLRLLPAATTTTAGGNDPTTTPRCHLTRILSYDLGGSLPRNLANTVLMQQAGLPGILSKHLKRVEPSPEPRLCTNEGPLTNERVIQDVLEPILQQDDTALVSSARRRLNFDKSAQELVSGEGLSSSLELHSTEVSLPLTAVILLLPVLVHHLSSTSGMLSEIFVGLWWFVHPAILFCVTAFVAVRYVVVSSLGYEIQQEVPQQISGGTTTCQFSVDLKGVLRFIGMKREEKNERSQAKGAASSSSQAEVSVVHIVATALAKAMRNHATCWNYRRVKLPLLLIDGCYHYPSSKLALSVSLASGRLLTIEDFRLKNIPAVANALLAAEKASQEDIHSSWMLPLSQSISKLLSLPTGQPRHGRCLIVLTKTDSAADNQTSKSSDAPGVEITQCQLPDDLDVLVVVGGIRLQRNTGAVMGSPARALPPKPILSLSLAINTASVLDVAKCNAFAEDLQKFIQFPELCDG